MTAIIENTVNVYMGLQTRVLEDDPDMREMLRSMFAEMGVPNVVFYSASEEVVAGMTGNIHLFILDQRIPKSDPKLQGIDVAYIARVKYPKAKIIMVSGSDDSEILKRIIKLRPDGYVYKTKDYLTELVHEAVRLLGDIVNNLQRANTAAERLEIREQDTV